VRSGSCGPEIPILRKFRLLILALHLSKCWAYQQAGERAPGEFGAIFGRQMLFDQRSHISERFQGQHIGQRGESSQPGFDVGLHAGVTPHPLNCQYERIDSRPAYCARALPHGERDSRG
jgi:hypothetical protein